MDRFQAKANRLSDRARRNADRAVPWLPKPARWFLRVIFKACSEQSIKVCEIRATLVNVSRFSWLRKNWCRAGVLAVTLTCLPACDTSNSQPGIKVGGAPAPAKEPAEVVSSLEAAQASMRRNPAGSISQVEFRKSPLTDALAGSLSKLEGLQTLIIANSEMTMSGWQEIGKLTKLRTLDLRECKLGDAHFKAAVSGMTELVVVRLSGKSGATTVSDEGIAALKNCSKLRALAGDFLFISEVGISELAGLQSLSELYLAGTLVDDAALERIAAIPNIVALRIAKTSVSKEGLEKLTKLQLEELDISECSKVDDSALEPIGKITTLKKLNMWRDPVGDAGMAFLKGLVNLEWLNVDNTQMTDAGLKSFAGYTKLTFLHLGSTAVSDAGMPDVLPMKSLKDLKVSRTSVTEAGVEPLRKAMPKLDIQLKYGRETETP